MEAKKKNENKELLKDLDEIEVLNLPAPSAEKVLEVKNKIKVKAANKLKKKQATPSGEAATSAVVVGRGGGGDAPEDMEM